MNEKHVMETLNGYNLGTGWNNYVGCSCRDKCLSEDTVIRGLLTTKDDDERLIMLFKIASVTHKETYWAEAYELIKGNPLLVDKGFLQFIAKGYKTNEEFSLCFCNQMSNRWLGRILEYVYSLGYKNDVCSHIVSAYKHIDYSIGSIFAEKIYCLGSEAYHFKDYKAQKIFDTLQALAIEAKHLGTPADEARISYYTLMLKNNCIEKNIIQYVHELNNWYSRYSYEEYNNILELNMSKDLFPHGWIEERYELFYDDQAEDDEEEDEDEFDYNEDESMYTIAKELKKCYTTEWYSNFPM